MLEDVEGIQDPLLRAETAGEIMEAARRLRNASICEAAKTLSVRKVSEAVGLGKSTVNQIVRAGVDSSA